MSVGGVARIGLVLLGAVMAGLVTVELRVVSPTAIAVIFAGLVASIPFMHALVSRRIDIFEPVYLFAAAYAFLFVIRPAFDLARPGGVGSWLGYDVSLTYTPAIVYSIVGALAFYAGYYTKLPSRIARSLPLPSLPRSNAAFDSTIAAMFVAVAVLFAPFLATIGGLSGLLDVLRGTNFQISQAMQSSTGYTFAAPLALTSLGMLLLGLAATWWSRRGFIGFLLIVASQALQVAGGERSWILPAVLAVVMLWYLRRGTRPSLALIAVGTVFLFFGGIVTPREARQVAPGALQRTSYTDAFVKTASDPGQSVQSVFQGADASMVNDFAAELQFVPSVLPWRYGRTYVEALGLPVPRALWPGKPLASDTQLMKVIWPDFYKRKVGFSFSVFGEPYMNFGVPGIIFVLFLFGIFWSTIYRWMLRAPDNRAVAVLYALNWPFLFVYMRGGITVDYQRQAIAVLPALAAIIIANARGRDRSREHRMAVVGVRRVAM